MLPIARTELDQLLRNRSVLVSSLLMPLAVAVYFIVNRDQFARIGSLGYIAALLAFTVAAFTLYSTTVTTLAARRQTLFLKRLRSSAAGDRAILSGLLLPVGAVSLLQVAVILVALGAVSGAPANPVVIGGAVVVGMIMMLAWGIATAGVTNSPEHAQVTALPLSLGVIVVASWVGITGTGDLTWLKRSLPAGAPTELIVDAWNGPVAAGDVLLLAALTVAWTVIAAVVAVRMFRWEPRR